MREKPVGDYFFANSEKERHDGRYTPPMEKTQKEWVLREKQWSLEQALIHRGITTPKEQERFLHPDYERDLHDPFLFQDMEKAVAYIKKTIDANEKIIIFGDYDADGTSGAVIFHDFFLLTDYQNYAVYIPDRFREGYGLQMKHVKKFLQDNVKLIITIDCGITSFEEITYAEEHDAHVIVLDHHLIPPAWPPASAIIDPKRESDPYPYRFLSGAALAWKTICALLSRYHPEKKEMARWMLDVVAIAAVADMVPLTHENRTLVSYGLKVLEKTRRLGLQALYRAANVRVPLSTEDIGFVIAPRINAASRMDHANISFGLLTTSSFDEAEHLSHHLEEKNKERKLLVERIVNAIIPKLQNTNYPSFAEWLRTGRQLLVEGDPMWPPGVLGIAATRIMERFRMPVFLWGGVGNEAEQTIYRGSCRSLGDINVVDLMRAANKNGAEPLFEDFGGHKQAGGFALAADHVNELEPRLLKALENIPKERTDNQLILEAKLKPEEITEVLFEEIEQLRPFGMGNPKPLFLFAGVEIKEVKELGNGKGYFKILIARKDAAPLEAVSFNGLGHEWLSKLNAGDVIDLAASIERNTWNGNTALRLRIEDIKKT